MNFRNLDYYSTVSPYSTTSDYYWDDCVSSNVYGNAYGANKIKHNELYICINIKGPKVLYIERPNCEDVVNIKKLNAGIPSEDIAKAKFLNIITDEDLANSYASSFDEIPDNKKYSPAVRNVEEISIGQYGVNKIIISEQEYHTIVADADYRQNRITTQIDNTLLKLRDRLFKEIGDLDLNPNFYLERVDKLMDVYKNGVSVTIEDAFDIVIASIDLKDNKITEVSTFEKTKVEEEMLRDVVFTAADSIMYELTAMRDGQKPNLPIIFRTIVDTIRSLGRPDIAAEGTNYFNELVMRIDEIERDGAIYKKVSKDGWNIGEE